jgi:hypothetical protein
MRRRIGVIVAAGLALLLAGCLLLPGKFASDIDVRKDGTFTFNYKGELYFMPLADPKAGEEVQGANPAIVDVPESCYDEETIEERPCTKDELAKREADMAAQEKAAADKKEKDAAMTRAMLGGIDPSDPKAAEAFADRLLRQPGWKSVVYKGDGLFDVEYSLTARLDHDFVFPTIEKMSGVSPFVTIVRRNDGSVRIEAPGFSSGPASSPMAAFMQAMSEGTGPKPKVEGKLPVPQGTFAIVTDAEILANDTDEGPKADAGGKRLSWKIDAQTQAAPTALLKLGQ